MKRVVISAALAGALGTAGLAPAGAQAARSPAAIRFGPAAAMPGSSVLVEGMGWPARTHVSFSLGGVHTGAGGNYGAATADGRGRFQAFVTLRTLPNGQPIPTPSTVVLVAHTADYRLKATAPIVVAKPTITADRRSGAAGTTVSLSGRGWPSGTHVTVSLGGKATDAGGAYGSAVANAKGRFTVRAKLAALPNGAPLPAGRVVLLAHNADGSLKASVPFTVTR